MAGFVLLALVVVLLLLPSALYRAGFQAGYRARDREVTAALRAYRGGGS